MSSELTMGLMLTITLGAAFFVTWPLLIGRTDPEEFFETKPTEPVLRQLLFERDTTYAAMKELEFDHAMGNLSQQDFQQLQDRYKRKAVALLKRIDDAKAGKLPSRRARDEEEEDFETDLLPRPVSRGVGGREGRVDLDVEMQVEEFRRKSRGAERPGGAPSSSGGSQGRRTPSSICPSCGRAASDSEARFCSKCGAPMSGSAKR